MVTGIKPDIAVLDLPFDDYVVKPTSAESIRTVVSAMSVRNTYDEPRRELVAVTSKMATIESKLSVAELHESPEYAAVQARFADLRCEIGFGLSDANHTREYDDSRFQPLAAVRSGHTLVSGDRSCH